MWYNTHVVLYHFFCKGIVYLAEQIVTIENAELVPPLFGSFDANMKLLENEYGVNIICRGNELKVTGDAEQVSKTAATLDSLVTLLKHGDQLNEQNIRYTMSLVKEGKQSRIVELTDSCIAITTKGRPVKAKTLGQKKYVDAIQKNTVAFGIGPAGTGKTYLAVAMAVRAFKAHEVDRIILTRPAVEAGEKLGFLPGDLQNKVDPYLRPLYDALFEMLGAEVFQRCLERGTIEVAPLAYMRGRTLDDSFIILDEAQNTTHEQMKMFLTRLGMNSKAVITGDITQIDLTDRKTSGLLEATKILKGIEDLEVVMLSDRDVVRHKMVQRIVQAYERYYEKGRK